MWKLNFVVTRIQSLDNLMEEWITRIYLSNVCKLTINIEHDEKVAQVLKLF